MIVVDANSFNMVLAKLNGDTHLSCDTETTGFFAWKRDRLFMIQFSDATEDYIFNFQKYKTGEAVLDFSLIKLLQPLFNDKTIFIQNAKFDMAFLWKEGVRFDLTDIHDTEVAGRLVRNDHLKYSLDEQAKREFGESKDDRVMDYLKKNKVFTAETIPGKDTVVKNYHFDKVPFEIIAPYGCKDTRLTYQLGMKQIQQIDDLSANALPGSNTVKHVHEMEKRLIHTCFEMERIGILVDKEYCYEAIKHEDNRIFEAKASFTEHTNGLELTDSGQCLGPIFESLGFTPEKTATGEHEITDTFLETVSHPLGKIVQTFREARKRANTYFRSFLYYADSQGVLHANMKQAGTKTGRFSYMDPNLQNLPKDDPDAEEVDNSPFPIRRAFIPRPGFFFLSIDYKQMEFRMMLDEAAQHDLINKIKEGHDPHVATAELTGLIRKAAKTLNFGLLYGMGIIKLAFSIMKMDANQKRCLKSYDVYDKSKTLELMNPVDRAVAEPIVIEMKKFKKQYFNALPMVENFILLCTSAVKTRHAQNPGNGWIKTWFGRRAYFSSPEFAYKAANAKIQGGCADVVKIAMWKLNSFLQCFDSRMLVQIHDEILFEISFKEMQVIDGIMNIMETAYPHRFLPLTCSMSHSLKSFYDMTEGDPRKVEGFGQTERDEFQRESHSPIKETSQFVVS